MNTLPSLPEAGFVRLPTILALFPISKSAWWDGVRQGKYPQPVKLSERTTAWRVSDIRQLLESIGKTDKLEPMGTARKKEPDSRWRRPQSQDSGA